MAKKPWFYFFPSDWLGSNKRACMSLEQQGAYINLLARQWSEPSCSLPDDDEVLAALSEMGEGWFNDGSAVLRRCFPEHPELEGRIANARLLELREEQEHWREKSSEGGRKSGAARRMRAAANSRTTLEPPCEPNANQTPTKTQPSIPIPKSDVLPDGNTSRGRTMLRFDDADLGVAKWMYQLVRRVNPDATEPKYPNWANTIRLIREKDGHTYAEIRELFELANQDEFWGPNILSPDKLRKQWKKGLAVKLKPKGRRADSDDDRPYTAI